MSLTPEESQRTKAELNANYQLANLSLAQIAQDLQTTPAHVQEVLNLNVRRIEEPWILKHYLDTQIKAAGNQPLPYSRLVGSPAKYWFLNNRFIKKGLLA
ncbi:MAG: DUF2316 family protein [Lactobacillus sp.]|jgi:hypothetical protein|nr:DUF2316 family protein [Lactobacillus sp.]